ncbi:MAG: hypothetical protein AMXMBFR13_17090 [Phycisphaerae bacterium]
MQRLGVNGIVTAMVACAAAAAHAQPVTVFTDGFEVDMSNWQPWLPISTAGAFWGPNNLAREANHPHSGSHAARQEQGSPGWWGSIHLEPALTDSLDKKVHVKAWQFEDYDRREPQATDHYQVQGWVALMDGDAEGNVTEWFAIGVHAHRFSPEPVLDWWQHFSWGTAEDGWHVTSFPRSQGYNQLEIVVHPYSGQVGDVEFFIDGVLVGQGRRQPGPQNRGIELTKIGLGANHELMTEDYVANSYEFFWYDDVELILTPESVCPNPDVRFDIDGDNDVDQEDFGYFQLCYTGVGFVFTGPNCRCMNGDGDQDIDADDFGAFQACASGPAIPAPSGCDDALPPP